MAALKFRYLTETQYENLSNEEKNVKNTIFMVKGKHSNAIYNNGKHYASSTSLCSVDTIAELPTIGTTGIVYIVDNNTLYIWNDESLCYVNMSDHYYDIVNGGDATSKIDITV